MVAIFDNNGSGKLRREINLYQGGDRRSKIRRGGGGGVKITPARSHRYFAILCSPTNGVLIGAITLLYCWRKRTMANSDREVIGLDSALDEALGVFRNLTCLAH